MEERVSGIEDMIEEMKSSVKAKAKSKRLLTQNHTENLEDHEKAELKNNMNRGKRRIPTQRTRKYFQQNHRKKFPNLKKKCVNKNVRTIQNSNHIGAEKFSCHKIIKTLIY